MQEINVSVVILYDGPLMLVNLRPEGTYFSGWWEWPGGKQQEGETSLDCAVRELQEEIGLYQPDLSEYAIECVEYPGRKIRLRFFVGRRPPGDAAADALEHRWVDPGEVLSMRFLEPNLPVLQRLIADPPFRDD